MKKFLFTIFIVSTIIISFFSCVNKTKDYTAIVTFEGEKYEQYQGTLDPNGYLSKSISSGEISYYESDDDMVSEENVNIQTYGQDSNNIFIFVSGDNFIEGKIFHKIGDLCPRINDINNISKIEIFPSNGEDSYFLSQEDKVKYVKFLSEIINGTNKFSISTTGGTPGTGNIVTYFKDYPACDRSVFISSLDDGEIGISFSETSLNKSYFGSYDSVAIVPGSLTEVIQ